jgi:hypothetical protein
MIVRFSIPFASVALAILVSGQAVAQEPFEFRFEFGTYCG